MTENSFIVVISLCCFEFFFFTKLLHVTQQVHRKGPLWRNSAFAFESANHFLLSSVQGTNKSLSHVVDNFLLRQQRVPALIEAEVLDDAFTAPVGTSKTFATLECGPGHLCSRYRFPCWSQVLASLSYSRLERNWSECITRLKNGDFVVTVIYHHDPKGSTTVIVQKYRLARPKSFVNSTTTFYYEIGDLDPNYDTAEVNDFQATRVVFLSGNIENCLVSLIEEGFEHN